MHLNTLKPAAGSKKVGKRLGRGIGSGKGKTCGRGHKGQHARAGGFHKVGFEGGQMPLQRRLPKFGFNSRKRAFRAEIRLAQLNKVDAKQIDIAALQAANLIQNHIREVKIIANGKIEKAIHCVGLKVTQGARDAILAAGGTIA